MAKTPERDRVGADQKQVKAAGDVTKQWEEDYACEMLEQYFYGRQWEGDINDWNKKKYVINLFFPSIEISKPSLLFQVPKYKVIPRPTRIDDPLSDVEARSKLQEETLNSYVQDPDFGFKTETALAIQDAQFRFGVVQVGYTADFIDNPEADKPILSDQLNDDGTPKEMQDANGEVIRQPKQTIRSERAYLKWISAKQWRVSANSHNRIEACDWCGYYEWHYASDIKANTRYNKKATVDLQATGSIKAQYRDDSTNNDERKPGMVKIWFKWDLRAKERRIWAEGGERYLLVEDFKILPFAVLKFHEILGQWHPMPPTYNWVHPQNQLNDGREMRRVHRNRAIRRYLRSPQMQKEEFEKLAEGDDMVCAESPNPTTDLVPVLDAPLDAAIFRDMQDHLEDFTRVSGISGESQQVAQSETATQANLIALMGQTRENAKRQVVGLWLGDIGRLILRTLRDKMALPFWIKNAVDPTSPLAVEEAQEVAKLWKQIASEDLGDIDNDIQVDLASMSPVQQTQERQDWLTFLGLLTNSALGVVLSNSPELMRKTAGLFNITSERTLAEVNQALQKSAMMMLQAQAAKAGVPMPQQPQPGQTPTNPEIGNQIAQQLPTEVLQ